MSPRISHPLPSSWAYEQTDIPPGMTIAEYRRRRASGPPALRYVRRALARLARRRRP